MDLRGYSVCPVTRFAEQRILVLILVCVIAAQGRKTMGQRALLADMVGC